MQAQKKALALLQFVQAKTSDSIGSCVYLCSESCRDCKRSFLARDSRIEITRICRFYGNCVVGEFSRLTGSERRARTRVASANVRGERETLDVAPSRKNTLPQFPPRETLNLRVVHHAIVIGPMKMRTALSARKHLPSFFLHFFLTREFSVRDSTNFRARDALEFDDYGEQVPRIV